MEVDWSYNKQYNNFPEYADLIFHKKGRLISGTYGQFSRKLLKLFSFTKEYRTEKSENPVVFCCALILVKLG